MAIDREGPDFNAIRDAFERMAPDTEAEERMLASLLEATGTPRPLMPRGTGRTSESAKLKGKHAAAAASHTIPRWLRIGVAACLALVVVGGVVGYGATAAHDGARTASEQAAQFTGSSPNGPTADGDGSHPEDPEGYAASPEDPSGSVLRDYSEAALSHPLVELSSGTRLRIVLGEDGSPLLANEAALAADPEAAWALDETGTSTMSCYVRALAGDDYSYAVSYAEDGEFYLAEPVS